MHIIYIYIQTYTVPPMRKPVHSRPLILGTCLQLSACFTANTPFALNPVNKYAQISMCSMKCNDCV